MKEMENNGKFFLFLLFTPRFLCYFLDSSLPEGLLCRAVVMW